jgi:hypothetical protein
MPVEMQLRYNNLLFFEKLETGDIDWDVLDILINNFCLYPFYDQIPKP